MDFKLSNGDEITFDLEKLSFGEWQEMRAPAFARKKELEILSRVSGLDIEFIKKMNMVEAKEFYAALIQKIINPLEKN